MNRKLKEKKYRKTIKLDDDSMNVLLKLKTKICNIIVVEHIFFDYVLDLFIILHFDIFSHHINRIPCTDWFLCSSLFGYTSKIGFKLSCNKFIGIDVVIFGIAKENVKNNKHVIKSKHTCASILIDMFRGIYL